MQNKETEPRFNHSEIVKHLASFALAPYSLDDLELRDGTFRNAIAVRENRIRYHMGAAASFFTCGDKSVLGTEALYHILRQRLPAKNVYYYRCPDHRRNYVMSFAFCFDREDDVYQFAYCYPYTYSRLQHYLDSLERRNLDYLQREQLGLSVVSV
ncbi:hypothetical protein DPEC_G00341660 [Dallia pectoralis]|uniref:Uncharacterized protein n=1 Tax=Dallia pectoralis TaxID=75939 RepID=A0ACC2F5U5_DALPE|nr:hypothetical protein DPEC_G00341660 [Dallia pectoralis]